MTASTSKKIIAATTALVLAVGIGLGFYLQANAAGNNALNVNVTTDYKKRPAKEVRSHLDGSKTIDIVIDKDAFKDSGSLQSPTCDGVVVKYNETGFGLLQGNMFYIPEGTTGTTGSYNFTIKNAGRIITTGELVDINIAASIEISEPLSTAYRSTAADQGKNYGWLELYKIGDAQLGHAGCGYTRLGVAQTWTVRVYEAGTNKEITDKRFVAQFEDLDITGLGDSYTNVYAEGVELRNNFDKESITIGKAVPIADTIPPSHTDTNGNPTDGQILYTANYPGTSNPWIHASHSCKGENFYDSAFAVAASNDFEFTWRGRNCQTEVGLFGVKNAYVQLGKKSTNSTTTTGNASEYIGKNEYLYSLATSEFLVRCISSPYLSASKAWPVNIGSFICNNWDGGPCDVLEGPKKSGTTDTLVLVEGTYEIVEIVAPGEASGKGYETPSNRVVKTFSVAEDKTESIRGDDAVYNTPYGRLKMGKRSEDESTEKAPLCDLDRDGTEPYSLWGAKFDVKDKDGTVVGTFKCNKPEGGLCDVESATYGYHNEVMLLPAGTYSIWETDGPEKGYGASIGKVKDVTITAGDLTKVTDGDGGLGAIKNKPYGRLKMDKGSTVAATQASPLCPALYSLKNATFNVCDAGGAAVGSFKCVNAEGGTCEVMGTPTYGANGTYEIMLPEGTYSIVEVDAPEYGYVHQPWETLKSGVSVTGGQLTHLTGDNEVKNIPYGRLKLDKNSSVGGEEIQSPLTPTYYDLSGAEFDVICESCDYGHDAVAGTTYGHYQSIYPSGGICKVTSGVYRAADIDGDGVVETLTLPPGKYKVVETRAPNMGYVPAVGDALASNVDVFAGTETYLTGERSLKNVPMARIMVEKVSDEKDSWSYWLGTYCRAGADYNVYADAACTSQRLNERSPHTQYESTVTTRYEQVGAGTTVAGDAQSVAVNPGGTRTSNAQPGVVEQSAWRVRSNVFMVDATKACYVKEVKASEGYALDKVAHGVLALNPGKLTTVTSTEPPVEDPISIFKQDATYRALSATGANPLCSQYLSDNTSVTTRKTHRQIPQGDASSNNAQYRVEYYHGYYATASAAASSGALQRTWTMKTATDATYGQGYSHLDVAHLVAGSGGLYYNAANAVTQAEATVPLGTIVVTEVRASDGYTLKNADLNDVYTYVVQVKKINDTTTTANFVGQNYMSGTLDTNMNSRGELDSYNVVQRSDAWALKGNWAWRVMQEGYDLGHEWDMIYDNRVAATNPNPTSTVAGATFEFYNRSTYPVISPTDGKTIVPSGGSHASFERDRYTYHEDEDMVRVCIHEWRELNAASDVAQRVCGIITDGLSRAQ